MAAINLTGPHDLNRLTVYLTVSDPYGMYVLVDSNKKVLRVGRSDDDLKKRITDYIGLQKFAQCTQFWFQKAGSIQEAFELECLAFHHYQPPLNDIHPARPAGTNYACPTGCGL